MISISKSSLNQGSKVAIFQVDQAPAWLSLYSFDAAAKVVIRLNAVLTSGTSTLIIRLRKTRF